MGAGTLTWTAGETDGSHQVKRGQKKVLACNSPGYLLACSLDWFLLLSTSTFPNCLIVSWGDAEGSQEAIWMRPLGFEGNEGLAVWTEVPGRSVSASANSDCHIRFIDTD